MKILSRKVDCWFSVNFYCLVGKQIFGAIWAPNDYNVCFVENTDNFVLKFCSTYFQSKSETLGSDITYAIDTHLLSLNKSLEFLTFTE